MDTVPEIPRCLLMFPPKYGTYLISIFGLGSGGCGLAGIILYGLVEDSVIAHFVNQNEVDPTVKKAVLVTIGLSSLLLFCASVLLFLGMAFNSPPAILTGVHTIFFMCLLLIFAAIAAPMSCFFLPTTCVIKKLSNALFVLGYLFITCFLWVWLYFMVVVFNYLNTII